MSSCPTCGKDCKSERAVAIHHSHAHGKSIAKDTSNCNLCGEKFTYYKKKSEGKYCSKQCTPKEPPVYSGKNHPSYNSKERTCYQCGENVLVNKVRRDNNDKYFCDNNCYGKFLSSEYRNGGNPMYIDGNSRRRAGYTGKWNAVRKNALQRDNYTCQKCGKTKEELGVNPDVHHIKPVRVFSNSQDAHKLSNVICLCKSCHRVEENRRV